MADVQAIVPMTVIDPMEKSRVYHFPDGKTFKVENVVAICARPSGTHRLETRDGRKWIIPTGWLAVELDVERWTL